MRRDLDIINNSSTQLHEPTTNATVGSLQETQVTKRPTLLCSKRERSKNTANISFFLQKKSNGIWIELVISL